MDIEIILLLGGIISVLVFVTGILLGEEASPTRRVLQFPAAAATMIILLVSAMNAFAKMSYIGFIVQCFLAIILFDAIRHSLIYLGKNVLRQQARKRKSA